MPDYEPQHSLVLQQPPRPHRLLLLYHGVGSSAQDLASLGTLLGHQDRGCMVVSVNAPFSTDFGQGWQWFSVGSVTEENRIRRVAEAMPLFVQSVHYWQKLARVSAADTWLLGFSQGSIMALESLRESSPVAGHILAIAGRLARPLDAATSDTCVSLFHGESDGVIPVQYSNDACRQLRALGLTASVQTFSKLGHGINQEMLQALVSAFVDDPHRA